MLVQDLAGPLVHLDVGNDPRRDDASCPAPLAGYGIPGSAESATVLETNGRL